jgi:hypothetical protein
MCELLDMHNTHAQLYVHTRPFLRVRTMSVAGRLLACLLHRIATPDVLMSFPARCVRIDYKLRPATLRQVMLLLFLLLLISATFLLRP